VDIDGSNNHQLSDAEMIAGDASWSPDGQWIVFSTYPLFEYGDAPGPSNLYRVHPDGSGLEQLTFNETTSLRATLPHYSPDGEWIIFTAVTPKDRSLFAIPAAGGDPTVIAQGSGAPNNYTFGVWQP
jgi:Tol biopolymer transport system component